MHLHYLVRFRSCSILLLITLALLCGCASMSPPRGLSPVSNFDLGRFSGKWYEIARLDHWFEEDLEQVTAEYEVLPDGRIRITNRGYNPRTGKWETAYGKARFTTSPDVGSLRVSFFGPFAGSYHVLSLDREDYQYALVSGPNRRYLWILSRTPQLEQNKLEELISLANQWGFPTEDLVHVKH